MRAAFTLAFQALAANKLRAALTMLGTVIGVACVAALWNIGASGRRYMGDSLSSIGQHLILVRAKWDAGDEGRARFRYRPLRLREFEAVRDFCPSVAEASPVVMGGADAVFGGQRKATQVWGCTPAMLNIRGWSLARGTSFGDQDVSGATRVALLGDTVAKELLGSLDPVGQTVLINRVPFRVVGVLKPKGSLFGDNQDNCVLAPYTTVADQMGWGRDFHMLWASARSRAVIPQAKNEIRLALRQSQNLPPDRPDAATLEDLGEMSEAVDKVLVGISLLLGAIGAISLLVGGIGIMNIMLVSVTERTREIGLRMALGATDFAILTQFLIEAMVLSLLGGLVGLALGSLGALAVSKVLSLVTSTSWPFVIEPLSLAVALLFALAVGVFFGFYPAWRASRLDPIEALRHE